MQKEGTEPREANKKPIRISHSEQALRQINILAHNNKGAKAKRDRMGRGGEGLTQRRMQVRAKRQWGSPGEGS